MRRLKTRTIWIIVGIAFLLAILLIIACAFSKGIWTNVIIVLLVIDFIVLTIGVQAASFQTFRYKMKPVNHPTKTFSGDYYSLAKRLEVLKYSKRKMRYGVSYLKINNEVAYKCVLVEDVAKYFDPNPEETAGEGNKALNKCKRFIGIEIFKCIDEANVHKLADFSLQGKNIYYTALLNQDNNVLKCLNYVEPNGDFKMDFDNILHDLGITMEEN